ncbi:unnamed protein product [Larinioides sclopetarius]|uniref:BTB domain-containing protein n=1 Tax=Larinioides sclopetarius TaxID=280406 RepID=A0AAV2B8L7_9ARAC
MQTSFDVYWKIKNFSYCWEDIRSPEFTYNGKQCWLKIEKKYQRYKISCLNSSGEIYAVGQISFLTCNGSQEESSELLRGCSLLSLPVSKHIIFGQRRNAFLPKDTSTIRCRFFKEIVNVKKRIVEERSNESTNVYIQSQIGVKSKCFLWTLKEFSQQYGGKTLSVENSDLYGNIQLNLKSSGGINSDEQFYIEISRRDGEKCYSVLKVSVLDNEGKAVNCVSDEFVFEKENWQRNWRFPPVIRNSKLLACKNLLLPNDTLSLKCDFAITLGKVTDETAVYSCFEDNVPMLKDFEDSAIRFKAGSSSDSVTDLKTDLKTILDNGILCDVNLQVGSNVIQAHKNILSARSPVFKAMFTKDMKETINKTVVIEDIDVNTIRRLLLYMYSDAIHDYHNGKISWTCISQPTSTMFWA